MRDRVGGERAARLERLLDEFSYPERQSPALLTEIDALIGAAREEGLLPSGVAPAEVRAAIGSPHRVIGEEHEGKFDWHYPSLPPEGASLEATDWNLVLHFVHGVLHSTELRIWRERL